MSYLSSHIKSFTPLLLYKYQILPLHCCRHFFIKWAAPFGAAYMSLTQKQHLDHAFAVFLTDTVFFGNVTLSSFQISSTYS